MLGLTSPDYESEGRTFELFRARQLTGQLLPSNSFSRSARVRVVLRGATEGPLSICWISALRLTSCCWILRCARQFNEGFRVASAINRALFERRMQNGYEALAYKHQVPYLIESVSLARKRLLIDAIARTHACMSKESGYVACRNTAL